MPGPGLAGLPRRGGGRHLVREVLAGRWLSGRSYQAETDLRLAGCWGLKFPETSQARRMAEAGSWQRGTGSLSRCCLRVALSEVPEAQSWNGQCSR